jgi:HSP20 family protein
MAIVRWDPVRDADSLQSDVNRLFDSFLGARAGNGAQRRWVPAMDLVETDDHLVLRADLPGMREDDVEIEVKDRVLSVSGSRPAEHEENEEGFHRVERSFGSFSRSLTLPVGVDASDISAEFDRGVLQVRIPKPTESKPTRIEIGASAVEGSGSEKK